MSPYAYSRKKTKKRIVTQLNHNMCKLQDRLRQRLLLYQGIEKGTPELLWWLQVYPMGCILMKWTRH